MENQDCYQKVTEPKYECLLFDVDDTLYPLSSGVSVECTKNIIEYMINKLQIEVHKAPEMCARLYKDYGTTMAGLRAIGYDFDYDDYHSFVHGRLPYDWLKPDHTLRSLLHSLPTRKIIFSNGDEAHVSQILSRLGIEDCFDDIICFETLNPTHKDAVVDDFDGLPQSPIVCKPFGNAFEQAFKIPEINPHKTLFFDDSIRNLQTAKALGLQTVLVSRIMWNYFLEFLNPLLPFQVGNSHRTKGVDYALESIHNMKEALSELWEAREKMDTLHSEKASLETCVTA